MKKYFVFLALSLVSVFGYAQTKSADKAAAQKAKAERRMEKRRLAEEKRQAEEAMYWNKMPGKVYVFGCSFEFGDSVLYITDVNEVDSVMLFKKTKFLPYRSDFSQQFKENLEHGVKHLQNQTSSVFYSDNKTKLEKTYNSLIKKYLKKREMSIVRIREDEFKFVHPLDHNSVPAE